MRKLATFITIFFICAGSFSLAETEKKTGTKKISLTEESQPTGRSIDIIYPITTQAVLRILDIEIIKRDNKKILTISGKVENMLTRELRNASITLEFFNKDGGSLDSITADILPRVISRGKKYGRFSAEINDSPDITSCQIKIEWQGQE
jgi:hypothetical protein